MGPAVPVVEQVLRGLSGTADPVRGVARSGSRRKSIACWRTLTCRLSRPGRVCSKNSRTTTVAETTMLVRGQPTQVIYKRFNRKKWLDPLLTLFRPPRAWRSWQAGQDLASRGIPTPQNLAYRVAPAIVQERPSLLVSAARDLPGHREAARRPEPGGVREAGASGFAARASGEQDSRPRPRRWPT